MASCHNMMEVLASILQQIAGLPDNKAVPLAVAGTKEATEKHLIGTISNFLKDKRYLVIVDDIWHYGEWQTIKMSLPDNDLGSRIVTTSRVSAITEKWSDDFDALVYKINCLKDYDVRRMIAMMPGMGIEGFEGFGDFFGVAGMMPYAVRDDFDCGHASVVMCAGMPLAVACMISALEEERKRQGQQGLCVETHEVQDRIEEQVKTNGIQNTPGFEPLVESLELGYNHLPHHMLKTCFLYCCIYPEDHEFRRNDLIRGWIAEGFVCKEEAANDYFDELVSRGLFQEFDSFGDYFFYKLHPIMRTYLRWKLREDNFITCTSDGITSSSPVGRLCIDYWPSTNAVDTLSGIGCHHVRSLVVFKDGERIPYQYFQYLRVLDVRYNPDLENRHLKNMCGLLRLRHLLVSGGLGGEGITEMPEEIARLQYLETLEVCSTWIRRLPAEIGDLKKLKTLDVSWNENVAELPREIANLHQLETLCIRGSSIREQAWEIIRTLKKLKTLDVSWNHELSGIPRDIGELQRLKNLDVSHNRGITELPNEIGKLLYLETLDMTGNRRITKLPKDIGKLQHLETLILYGTGITELPREIGNLQRLKTLNLRNVGTITKLPRDIGKLQHLEILNLGFTNVRKIPREIGALKKLKNLNAKIGTLPFEAGQLSKLEGLPKCVRQAWKNSDLMSLLAGEILSFSRTDTFGDGGLYVGTKHMHIPQWIKEHFNNVTSLDIRICKLEEQDLKILREMPYLEELKLRFEVVPRKPIVISNGGFAMLWHLVVDSRVPRITFQEGAMPNLKRLDFEFQFYGGPPNTDPVGIKHLVSLKGVIFRCNKWYRGDSPCINAAIDVVRKEAWEHPNRWFEKVTLSVNYQETVVFQSLDIAKSNQGINEAWSSGTNNDSFPENSIEQSSEHGNDAITSSGVEEIQEIQD